MSHVTLFRRAAGALGLATVLLFGAMAATPAHADTACKHAYWDCIVDTSQPGAVVPGAVTKFDDGTRIAMVVVDGKVRVVAAFAGRSFRDGVAVPVVLTV